MNEADKRNENLNLFKSLLATSSLFLFSTQPHSFLSLCSKCFWFTCINKTIGWSKIIQAICIFTINIERKKLQFITYMMHKKQTERNNVRNNVHKNTATHKIKMQMYAWLFTKNQKPFGQRRDIKLRFERQIITFLKFARWNFIKVKEVSKIITYTYAHKKQIK